MNTVLDELRTDSRAGGEGALAVSTEDQDMRSAIALHRFVPKLKQKWMASTARLRSSISLWERELVLSARRQATLDPVFIFGLQALSRRSYSSAINEARHKMNWDISPGQPDAKILLVTQASTQVVPLKVAMVVALNQGVQLVQVGYHSANEQPVCKLISREELLEKDSDREQKGNNSSGGTSRTRAKQKEVLIRSNISDNDLRVKAKNAAKFLLTGDTVLLKLPKLVGRKRTDTSNAEARKEKLDAEGVDRQLAESLKHPTMYSMYLMVRNMLAELEEGSDEILTIEPANVTSFGVSARMKLKAESHS